VLEIINQLDTRIFLFLNELHTPCCDVLMWHVSGKKTWIPLYAVVLFLYFRKYKIRGFYPLLFTVLVIALCDQISVHAFKEVFERLRPSHQAQLTDFVHVVNNYRGGSFGFVSSHAANSFGFAIFSAFMLNNGYYTWGIIFWAILVSYSRIYLGVHFPGDILGGMLLGSLSAYFVYFIFQKLNSKFKLISTSYY